MISLLLSLSLLAAAPPTPTLLPETPEGWRFERLDFPLSFAPELEYEGFEELQFAPGMFDPASDSYFSYVLAIRVDDALDTSGSGLERFLHTYYRGLCETVAETRNLDLDLTTIAVDVARDEDVLAATIEMYDVFVTTKPITLRLEMNVYRAGSVTEIFGAASPRPKDAPIWNDMRAIGARWSEVRRDVPAPGEPGEAITLTFDDLPPTLFTMDGGGAGPPSVTVRLPDDYTTDRTFPLFVFLEGGHGGGGANLRRPLQVGGGEGYIAANFPLFRKAPSDNEEASRFRVSFDDLPTVSHAYAVIMSRLRATIPNIDRDASVIGGHSNGANTLAVLLSGLDENMLDSFGGFFMIDGGFDWSSYGRTKTLRDTSILIIAGDDEPNPPYWRKHTLARMEHFQQVAERYDMTNWQFVVAPGKGHEFSPDYYPIIRAWMPGRTEP